jgi:hypothetical protein
VLSLVGIEAPGANTHARGNHHPASPKAGNPIIGGLTPPNTGEQRTGPSSYQGPPTSSTTNPNSSASVQRRQDAFVPQQSDTDRAPARSQGKTGTAPTERASPSASQPAKDKGHNARGGNGSSNGAPSATPPGHDTSNASTAHSARPANPPGHSEQGQPPGEARPGRGTSSSSHPAASSRRS